MLFGNAQEIGEILREVKARTVHRLFDDYTMEVSVHATLFEPHKNIIANVAITAEVHGDGSGRGSLMTAVDASSTACLGHRFQPSVTFELVVGAVALIQVLLQLDAIRHHGWSVREYFAASGWYVFDVILCLLFIAVVAVDAWVRGYVHAIIEIFAENHPEEYIDVSTLVSRMRVNYDTLALAMLLTFARLMRHLQVLPVVGPMLVSVIDTVKNSTVVMYVSLLLVVNFLFSIVFTTAMGTLVDEYSSIGGVCAGSVVSASVCSRREDSCTQRRPKPCSNSHLARWSCSGKQTTRV